MYDYAAAPAMISPTQVYEAMGASSLDLKGSMRDFYNELTRLFAEYADPNADLIIDGKVIPADQKYTPATTLLFNTKVNEMQQAQTTLLNVFNILFQLEKSLTGLSS